MSSESSPCRLFVYLACEVPVGVVLRRGPSDWVRLSLWHTDTDTFEHGQWMKGRVYERRADVSADGSLFLAFVRQSGGGRPNSPPDAADTWVAISRPPYFTALALWFVGGTYHTGGFFPDSESVWIGYGDPSPDLGSVPGWLRMTPPQDIAYNDRTPDWTDRTVHFNRLLRDGWELLENDTYRVKWQRRHPSQSLTLLMTQQFESFQEYGGPFVVEFELRHESSGETRSLGWGTWADWDQQGRLVLARDGRLFSLDDEGSSSEVADFNGQTPEPAPAPAWARDWPARP
jgi:hypothetical protein